jgi:hypothetical protein
VRKERKGKRRGAARSAAAVAAGGAGEKKERKGGKGETDEWGPGISESREKEKRERTRAGAGRGMVGRLGRKGGRRWFSFFSFSFSNFIFKPIFISNSNQTFQTFSQEFYKLFRNHTSNQKPCKPTDDAHTLVVSKFIKLYLIF